MNKKIVMRFMVAIVLFMSFFLCDKGVWNTGTIEAYANADIVETDEGDFLMSDEWEGEVFEKNKELRLEKYKGNKTIVEIPAEIDGYTVVGIDISMFGKCENGTKIKSIIIPESVRSITGDGFEGCSGLTSIVVDEKNKKFDSRDNCNAIIETSSNSLVAGCKNTVIPKSVKEIGEFAFYGCSGLKSITIPKSVKIIYMAAFMGCSNLERITIYEGVKKIDSCAFNECSSLKSITIPESVTSIENDAFGGCSSLKSITIPRNVKYIDCTAFSGCSSLTSIVVDKNNSVYDSRDNCNAIIETSSKTLIAGCKNTVIPKGVKRIARKAFSGRSGLKSIAIPEGVNTIDDNAFENCSSLTSIIIPRDVKYIDLAAFSGCSNLTSIVVDKNNKVYDSRNNCNAIIETSSKTLIAGCKKTVIPKGIKEIGAWAFEGCSGLKSIKIPQGVTGIDDRAFRGCSSLKSVTIPDSVKDIGYETFARCSSLKSITIPDSVKGIEGYAFDGCSSLKGITIPDSVKDIGDDAFVNVDKNFIIYSSEGSYAHEYALENNIPWRDSNSGSLDTFLISIEKTTYKYDGKEKTPSVTVDMGGTKLKKETDFTVEYADNVEVGTAKVIISGTGKYSGEVTKTFTINPSKVKDLKQNTSYYLNAITLTWENMPGVDGYRIYRATSENGTYKKVATVKKTTYKNNKLEPAKTYYYKVYAYKSKVKGEFSDAVAAGTKTKKPKLNVVGGKKNATLTWKEVTGADGYEVYMKAGESGKYKKVKTVKGNKTVFTKSKLTKGKKYSFKIRTFRTVSGKKIYSDWSAVKSVKIK